MGQGFHRIALICRRPATAVATEHAQHLVRLHHGKGMNTCELEVSRLGSEIALLSDGGRLPPWLSSTPASCAAAARQKEQIQSSRDQDSVKIHGSADSPTVSAGSAVAYSHLDAYQPHKAVRGACGQSAVVYGSHAVHRRWMTCGRKNGHSLGRKTVIWQMMSPNQQQTPWPGQPIALLEG